MWLGMEYIPYFGIEREMDDCWDQWNVMVFVVVGSANWNGCVSKTLDTPVGKVVS